MVLIALSDCRNLATQLWSRWFTGGTKSSSNTGNEFMMGGGEAQGSMLPEDMDLSIYAPDTGSATATIFNYTDSINMNLTEEMNVGMSMNNLTTLDMNSYAPYMGNNDYYAMNSVEPLAINTNIIDSSMSNAIGHENYMQSNYNNETIDDEQSLLNATPTPMETHPAPSWSTEPVPVTPPAAVATPVTSTITATSTINSTVNSTSTVTSTSTNVSNSEPVTGLPVLKIKVTKGGQPYVVNSSALLVPASDTKAEASSQPTDPPADDGKTKLSKDKSKDKEKKKDKDRDKDKKSSTKKEESSKKSGSGSGSGSSDSKKRDKDRSSSRARSSTSDKSDKVSKDKDRMKLKSKDDKSERRVKSQTEKETKQLKQAEKNRETLALLQARTASAVKMPKIPRKKPEDQDKSETTNVTEAPPTALSTDAVEKLQPRPKTVKTFNSKFRSTGLEEPVPRKPPGPPDATKKTAVAGSLKRSAAFDAAIAPLDKKAKAIDDAAISAAVAAVMRKTAAETKPAIKLISPRPRRKLSFSSSTVIFYHFYFSIISILIPPSSDHCPVILPQESQLNP